MHSSSETPPSGWERGGDVSHTPPHAGQWETHLKLMIRDLLPWGLQWRLAEMVWACEQGGCHDIKYGSFSTMGLFSLIHPWNQGGLPGDDLDLWSRYCVFTLWSNTVVFFHYIFYCLWHVFSKCIKPLNLFCTSSPVATWMLEFPSGSIKGIVMNWSHAPSLIKQKDLCISKQPFNKWHLLKLEGIHLKSIHLRFSPPTPPTHVQTQGTTSTMRPIPENYIYQLSQQVATGTLWIKCLLLLEKHM